MLKPENYTIEEAEFLFRCELDQLERHALISTQRRHEILQSHECLSQKRMEQRSHQKREQCVIPSKTPEEKRLQTINLFLILGTLFLAMAGLVFSTASWMAFGAVGRCVILTINIVFLFGVSVFTETKLGLQKTATTFWNLGLCLTPLIILSLSAFGALGDYLSLWGDGRFLLGILTSLLMIGLTHLSFKKFNQSLFLLPRHLFEMLAYGFSWCWFVLSLGFESFDAFLICLMGWGFALLVERFCLHESLASDALTEWFESIASPYLVAWLPLKQLILQWLIPLLCLGGLWLTSNEWVFLIGFSVLMAGLFSLMPSDEQRFSRFCYPLGIQTLLVGNFLASKLNEAFFAEGSTHLIFAGLNLVFVGAYGVLTYLVSESSLQTAFRQCLRFHAVAYFLMDSSYFVGEISLKFILSAIVLGTFSLEGLVRYPTATSKGMIHYGLHALWCFWFGALLGQNLSLSSAYFIVLGSTFALISQSFWLWIRPSYRWRGSEGGYLATLTLLTFSFVAVSDGFLWAFLGLMLLGGTGSFFIHHFSFSEVMKPWLGLLLFALSYSAILYEELMLTYSVVVLAMVLVSFFKGWIDSDSKIHSYLSFATWLFRVDSILLYGLVSADQDFAGLLTLEFFVLTLSVVSDFFHAQQPSDKQRFGSITLYLFSFFLSSTAMEGFNSFGLGETFVWLFFSLIATILSNRWIYRQENASFQQSEWVHLILFDIYGGLHALGDYEFITRAFVLSIFILQLVLSYLQSEPKYRRLSKWTLGLVTFFTFYDFFASINWMIYLVIFGVGFVLIAMKQEAKTRQNAGSEDDISDPFE